ERQVPARLAVKPRERKDRVVQVVRERLKRGRRRNVAFRDLGQRGFLRGHDGATAVPSIVPGFGRPAGAGKAISAVPPVSVSVTTYQTPSTRLIASATSR